MHAVKKIIADLKIESLALLICCRDSRVPIYAKVPAALAVGLFFSPVDLIPDFIPVLGYLDDAIIIPLLIKLSVKLIPPGILEENRKKASAAINDKIPVMRFAVVVIVMLWLSLAGLAVKLVFFRSR